MQVVPPTTTMFLCCLVVCFFGRALCVLTHQLPVNIKRLVWNAQKMFQIRGHGESDMSPTYVIRRIRELCEGLSVVLGDDALSLEAQRNATLLFKILVSKEESVCVLFFFYDHFSYLFVRLDRRRSPFPPWHTCEDGQTKRGLAERTSLWMLHTYSRASWCAKAILQWGYSCSFLWRNKICRRKSVEENAENFKNC